MFKRKEINEVFTIMIISSGFTMDAVSNRKIVKKIKSCKPSYWCMRHPDGYLIYYRTQSEKLTKRAKKLYNKIVELIKRDKNFENYRIGKGIGRFTG